jgi:hypothetical protein
MKKNYELALPENYKEAKVVDAGKNKLGVLLNLIALLATAVTVGVTVALLKPQNLFEELTQGGALSLVRLVIYVVILFGYVLLHELVHGIAYKALTNQKLIFGLTLTVAYCGVPNIYVYRKAALIALLAPFVVFLPPFLASVFLLSADIDKIFASFMLGMHIGGCSGDLYVTFLYLFKFKEPSVLMRDTGPKQIFYVKETPKAEEGS